jgi:hypothetical protein
MKWSREILDVTLDCGIYKNPKKCKGITDKHWEMFYNAYTSNDKSFLVETITEIQEKLKPKECEGYCVISGGK